MDIESAIAAANGLNLRPEQRKGDVVTGASPNEVLETSDDGTLTEQSLERVNERGVQKSLAAAIIGVGNAAITQWVRQGEIALTTDGFVPIREVRRKTVELALYKRGRKNRDGDMPPTSSIGQEAHAEARLGVAKADKAEIELEKLKGTLVSREETARAFAEVATVTRTRVMGVADTVTPLVMGKKEHYEILKIMKENLASALETLADTHG